MNLISINISNLLLILLFVLITNSKKRILFICHFLRINLNKNRKKLLWRFYTVTFFTRLLLLFKIGEHYTLFISMNKCFGISTIFLTIYLFFYWGNSSIRKCSSPVHGYCLSFGWAHSSLVLEFSLIDLIIGLLKRLMLEMFHPMT